MDSFTTEKQLINAMERLKTQMKDMQELFEAQDEEKHQEIQILLKERKELKEKIELLETKISDSHNNSSSLASTSNSASPFEHETTSSSITESGCCGSSQAMSDSHEMMYMEEYEKLQESYESVLKEKTYLEAKVHEMTSCLQDLQETAEELQKKSDEQQEMIERLVSENQSLTSTNKDLFQAVTEMEKQKHEFIEGDVPEPSSLFEQLQDAGYIEELQQNNNEQKELIQRLVAENESLTSANKDLYKVVTESKQRKNEAVEVIVAEPPKSLFEELPEAGDMDESLHYGKSLFEELQQKSNEQEEMIQRLVAENQRLSFTNEDLHKAVIDSKQQKNEAVEVAVAEAKSPFEELQEAAYIEELQQKNNEQKELIQRLVAENESLTSQEVIIQERIIYIEKPVKIRHRAADGLLLTLFSMISLYFFFCVYSGVPILHFVSPQHFHSTRRSHGAVPM